MMKKLMMFVILLVCVVGAAQAGVLYEDTFDNDTLATNTGVGSNGMVNNTIQNHSWVDDGDATFSTTGVTFRFRAIMYTADAFESSSGFKLTVEYTMSNTTAGAGACHFGFGLVRSDTDLSTYEGYNPFFTLDEPTYSIGVVPARETAAVQGFNFNDGVTPEVLEQQPTFPAGVSTPVVFEIDGSGNWTWSLNGVEQGSGTIDGGFDLSQSYHVVAYAQDDQYTRSIQYVKLEDLGPGKAHSPVPDGEDLIDPRDVSSVSWYSPLQDSDGNPAPDVYTVTGYDVYWSTVDANFVGESAVSTNQTEQSFDPTDFALPAITRGETYYWRVDTHVTLEDESTDTIEGSPWQFETLPIYVEPEITTFGSLITAIDILPEDLSAEITVDPDPAYYVPLISADFTLLEDDLAFPDGAVASVTKTSGTDYENPTATFTTDTPGTYKVLLEISDGTTTKEALAVVDVYEDGCQAAKDADNWVGANYYDRDGDCFVELEDYSEFAVDWLDDTAMPAPEEHIGLAGYVPASVWNLKKIEVESYNVNNLDPNSCSDYPISDTTGIQMENDPNSSASGGGYTTNGNAGAWIEYSVVVPTAKLNQPVDVYLGYGVLPASARTLSFGTADDPDRYGIVDVYSTGGWTTFVNTYAGQVTFDGIVGGARTVRVTWGDGINLDWFGFDF